MLAEPECAASRSHRSAPGWRAPSLDRSTGREDHETVSTGRSASSLWSVVLASALLVSVGAAPARAQTVDDVVARHRGGCTTAGVEGLSEQLVRSHLCMFPGSVTTFAPHPGITLTSSRVHPLSSVETRDALHRAAAGGPLQVTSAFRTLVQQYLLYEEGGCGLAAVPGSSNHQSGVAVDLSNYSAALSRMTSAGCRHPYPGDDPVHFDCPGPDMRSASVLVFQRLWNVAHPEDRIDEDGAWGPQTRARLGRSPASGFPSDGCETMPDRVWGAEFVAQSFPVAADPPIELRPGEEVEGYIELRNVGSETWDESTRLGTTEPRDRESLFSSSSWLSPSRPAGVSGTVAPGDTHRFTFTLRAPDALGEHRERFGVVQEGVTWFGDPGHLGPPDGQLEVRLMVVEAEPGGDGGVVVADAGAVAGDGGVSGGGSGVSGGCSCRASGRAWA